MDDNEIMKKSVNVIHGAIVTEPLDNLISHYSLLTKLKRVVAWLIRFKHYCMDRKAKHVKVSLSAGELEQAEHSLIAYVQKSAFSDEIDFNNFKLLKNNNSKIKRLNPIFFLCCSYHVFILLLAPSTKSKYYLKKILESQDHLFIKFFSKTYFSWSKLPACAAHSGPLSYCFRIILLWEHSCSTHPPTSLPPSWLILTLSPAE